MKDLEAAAAEMDPASEKLKGQNWKDALVPEQKALQHLLRAEATFRDIQVAFGSRWRILMYKIASLFMLTIGLASAEAVARS